MPEEEKQPDIAEKQEQVDPAELGRKLDAMQLERLTDLHKNLRETEMRIDQKLANFKRFVDNTEIAGRSMATGTVEKTHEQIIDEAAKKLIAGTGLSID